MKLKKIKAGEYANAFGKVEYRKSASGNPSSRYAHMVWMITYANGSIEWTKTLGEARYRLEPFCKR